jgi:hypothetical protein
MQQKRDADLLKEEAKRDLEQVNKAKEQMVEKAVKLEKEVN